MVKYFNVLSKDRSSTICLFELEYENSLGISFYNVQKRIQKLFMGVAEFLVQKH